MIKISIIVPVYNAENFLGKCLHSLIHQTLTDIEIIVVNDCSPDKSQWIINDLVMLYPNKIKALHLPFVHGVSRARNIGIEQATGEYLAFVDNDDWVDVKMMALMYQNAREFNSDIVVCSLYKVWGDQPQQWQLFPNRSQQIADNKYYAGYCVWNKIYLKSFWQKYNFLFEGVIEDVKLTPRILQKAKTISVVETPLYFYNQLNPASYYARTGLWKLCEVYEAHASLKAYYATIDEYRFLINFEWTIHQILRREQKWILLYRFIYDNKDLLKEMYSFKRRLSRFLVSFMPAIVMASVFNGFNKLKPLEKVFYNNRLKRKNNER